MPLIGLGSDKNTGFLSRKILSELLGKSSMQKVGGDEQKLLITCLSQHLLFVHKNVCDLNEPYRPRKVMLPFGNMK